MRKIVINGESTSAIPPQAGRGSWTHFVLNCSRFKGDTITNLASGGKKMQEIRSSFTATDRTYLPSPSAGQTNGNGIYFLFGCANDIVYDRTAAEIYADLLAIWNAARQYGALVAAFTVMPATASHFQGAKQQVWADLNDLIRSDASKYTFLIEADTVIPDPYDTTMLIDGLHTTPKAAKGIFDLVKEQVFPYI